MNLASVDLNLLVVLDALLAELSVTRAARRLGLSQSATSHALGRLRTLVGDVLLVRTPQGMVATPRALALQAPVKRILAGVEQALAHHDAFDPARSRQRFCLSLEEPGQIGMLPRLVERLRREAPHVLLEVAPQKEGEQWAALEGGAIDLAFSVTPPPRPGFHTYPVFRLPYVSLVRRGHPQAARGLDLETFLALGHIAVTRPGIADPDVDRLLAARGQARRLALRVPSLLPVPWLVASSDFVATVPGMLGTLVPRPGALVAHRPPLAIPPLHVSLVWHERSHDDAAQRWFRDVVLAVCGAMDGSARRRAPAARSARR